MHLIGSLRPVSPPIAAMPPTFLLDDENRAPRAADVRRHIATVRLLIAREQHRIQHRGVGTVLESSADGSYGAGRSHRPLETLTSPPVPLPGVTVSASRREPTPGGA